MIIWRKLINCPALQRSWGGWDCCACASHVCIENGARTSLPLVAGDDAVGHDVEHCKKEEADLRSKTPNRKWREATGAIFSRPPLPPWTGSWLWCKHRIAALPEIPTFQQYTIYTLILVIIIIIMITINMIAWSYKHYIACWYFSIITA